MARVPTGAYWEAAAALLALDWAVEEVLDEVLVLPPVVAEELRAQSLSKEFRL